MLRDWTLNRIRWSIRKIRLPIRGSDLVLDVGSGSNPHPAADVLLERFIDPKHRFGAPLVIDRPLILGDACRMPFKDKAFDYVVAFHVLEHMEDPAQFLSELGRVARAGYIETPNALFERLVPYDVHLLEVMEEDGALIIRKKEGPRPDPLISDRNLVSRHKGWNRLFYARPELFHVRYLWTDTIRYKVLNPEVSSAWFKQPDAAGATSGTIPTDRLSHNWDLRAMGLRALRCWYKWRRRNIPVQLCDLLACPDCRGSLAFDSNCITCVVCKRCFASTPIPDFNQSLPH